MSFRWGGGTSGADADWPMLYRLTADLIVLLHLAYIAFAVLGGVLVLRWWRLAWLHLPAAAWAAWVELYLRYCPLTPLENRLRALGGLGTYDTGFIAHYITPIIYPPGITPGIQTILGVLLAASYLVLYAIAWWLHRRREAARKLLLPVRLRQ